MLRFLFTISTKFPPMDEFPAEAFLKVAVQTTLPPHRWTSPAAVTEGGDTPNEMPGCHIDTPLPTNHLNWEATAAAGGPHRWWNTSVLPAPCNGWPSASASGLPDPACPRRDACIHLQCLGMSSTYTLGSRTLMFTLKHESSIREGQYKTVSVIQQKGI